jgi:Ig-like domain CHU_C associated/Secretion system C-terminal sorting domain
MKKKLYTIYPLLLLTNFLFAQTTPPPLLTGTANSICVGSSVTITASGCNGTITWSDRLGSGTSVTVTPTESMTYSARCTDNGFTSEPYNYTIIVNPIPNRPTIPSVNIQRGQTATLMTDCLGSVNWYDDKFDGSLIATTPTITTPILNETKEYYANCTLNGCTSRDRGTGRVEVFAPFSPPTISVSQSTICSGMPVTLTATGCSGSVRWSNNLGVGNSKTISPAVTTTYTAVCILGIIISNNSNAITINVNPTLPPPTVSALPINTGQKATLNGSNCAGTILWFDVPTGGTPIASGASYTTPNLTVPTPYYASCVVGTCESAPNRARVNVVFNSSANPPSISADKTVICIGETVNLTADGCFGTVTWSNTREAVTISDVPSTTTSYTATCTFNGETSANSNTITVTVVSQAPIPTIPATSTSPGQTATLVASGCTGGVVMWYKVPTGGVAVWGEASYTTPALTTNTTYYVSCTLGRCISARVPVTVQVLSAISTPVISISSPVVCAGSSVTLTATGCPGTVRWNNNIGTGNPKTITPTANATYTANCIVGLIISNESNSVSVIMSQMPTAPSIGTVNINPGQRATLTATGCIGMLSWYDVPTGGTVLHESFNKTFTTEVLQTGTVYYASCSIASCTSSTRGAGIVVVDNVAHPPVVSASSTNICSVQPVTLTASGCGGTVIWNNGTTGASITVSPNVTTSYSAICNIGFDLSAPSNIVTISVGSAPTPSVAPVSIASGSTATLTATGCTGGTIVWYNVMSGGFPLASANSYTTPALTANTTYYATCVVGTCMSSRVAGVVTINTPPPPPTSSCIVNRVRLKFRADCCHDRLIGATIQGSDNGTNWTTIYTFTTRGTGAWQDISINNNIAYNKVRFVASANGFGELHELEFYNGSTKLTGTFFGSGGQVPQSDASKAFDGIDANVLWHGATKGTGNFAGLTLTNCGSTPPPPPPASTGCVTNRVRLKFRNDCCQERLIGATIQGSNDGGSTWTTIYTFINRATGAWQEVTFANTMVYDRVRFVASRNGFGELYEIEFYNNGTKLTGTGFGSAGNNSNTNNALKALDGNELIFWHGPATRPGSTNFVGLILNSCTPVNVPTRMGVEQSKEVEVVESKLEVSPNPSTGLLRVKLNLTEPTEVNLSVLSPIGQALQLQKYPKQQGMFEETIDLSNYKAGLYLINIQTNNKRFTQKVILNK